MDGFSEKYTVLREKLIGLVGPAEFMLLAGRSGTRAKLAIFAVRVI
jgi:hypothetical protein